MSLFDDRIARCSHPKGEPQRLIAANGVVHVAMVCIDCNEATKPGHFEPHDTIYDRLDDLPIWRDYREQNPPCARCGDLASEEHHVYPKAVDGPEEAERWPKVWLCRKCHGLWHVRITRAALDGRLGRGTDRKNAR